MFLSTIRSIVFVIFVLGPISVFSQTLPSSAAAADKELLKPAQLDQLVAPIALYPDTLLSEVLMASTYPLEVVQAERWLNANKGLKGDQLKEAVDKQPWDDSVKSLIATPSVLEMMNSKIDWTQKLGNAVIDQQADIMDAVLRLRARAQANNKLQTTEQQKVVVNQEQGRQVIAIEPTDPNTVYVPYYDPGVVYGEWPYPDYPPYYWPAPGYIAASVIATGIAFGAGYALARWGSGRYWGGNVNWNRNNITVNRSGGGNNIATNWNRGAHAEQRLGNRGGREQGLNYRGSGGQRVINPGGDRVGVGERNGAANRGQNIANRGQNVAHRGAGNAGQRVGGGQRGQNVAHRGAGNAGQRVGGGQRGQNVAHRAGGGGAGGRGQHVAHRASAPRASAPRVSSGRSAHVAHRGGGGGMGAGGGRSGGGRGGGRRSDIRLKHDIVLVSRLENGLGLYRFSYNGSSKVYVGVLAQEVQQVMPQAVVRGTDGYLSVYYEKLGVRFDTYDHWIKSRVLPVSVRMQR
jgi:Protein of unknown function (DUF3300)/Chaperone of endosialidase